MVRFVGNTGLVVVNKNPSRQVPIDVTKCHRLDFAKYQSEPPLHADDFAYATPLFDYCPLTRTADPNAVATFLRHVRIKDCKVIGLSPKGFVLCLSAWTHAADNVKSHAIDKVLLLQDHKPSLFDPFFWTVLSRHLADSDNHCVPFSALTRWKQRPAYKFVDWMLSTATVNLRGLLYACQEQRHFSLKESKHSYSAHVLLAGFNTLTSRRYKSSLMEPLALMLQGNPVTSGYWKKRVPELCAYHELTKKQQYWVQVRKSVALWGRAGVSLKGLSRPQSMYTVNVAKRAKCDPQAVAIQFPDNDRAFIYDCAALRAVSQLARGERVLELVGVLVEDPSIPTLYDVLLGADPCSVIEPPLVNKRGVYCAGAHVSWDMMACALQRSDQTHVTVYVDIFRALGLVGPIADLAESLRLDFQQMLRDAQDQFSALWQADIRRKNKVKALDKATELTSHSDQLNMLRPLTVPRITPKPLVCTFEMLKEYAISGNY